MRRARIPDDCDPAVAALLRAVIERPAEDRGRAWWRIEAGAGLGQDAIRKHCYRQPARGMGVALLRRALNELGLDLAVVRRNTREIIA